MSSFQNTFMSVVFDAYSEVPDYITWLLHQDLTPAYKDYNALLTASEKMDIRSVHD
jgi:hypothetical protein